MRKIFFLFLILILSLFISTTKAYALSCIWKPVWSKYLDYDVIFTGTPTFLYKTVSEIEAYYVVSVDKVYKGKMLPVISLKYGTGYPWPADILSLKEKHLFYADQISPTEYKTHLCSLTTSSSQEKEIEFLEKINLGGQILSLNNLFPPAFIILFGFILIYILHKRYRKKRKPH